MTETPDERRDRIDGARREQAELLRQIGHEHASLVIRPSAMEAWHALQARLEVVDDQGLRRPCRGNEAKFSDYDAFNVPSPGRAKMMCGGCAAFAECHEYGDIANPGWAVYGGVAYGKSNADIERRETIRTTARGARNTKEEA